jgi:glycosyltransferase involved in cell wall biosynthesis
VVASSEFTMDADAATGRPEVMDVSVLVPAYNASEFLADSLRQLRDYLCQQPYASEIVVIDDGSSDDTAEVGERFAAELSSRAVRVIRSPQNEGKGGVSLIAKKRGFADQAPRVGGVV